MNPIETMPWVNLLTQDFHQQKMSDQHLLIQMLAKVSIKAFDCYSTGNFHELDALIGNNGCESHAFNILVLAHSETLQEEIEQLQANIAAIRDRTLNKRVLDSELTQDAQNIMVSQQMSYLIQSHLLTITKRVSKGVETTDSNLVVKVLGRSLSAVQPAIHKIVMATQVAMSHLSIQLMRVALGQIPLTERLVHIIMNNLEEYSPKEGITPKVYSSCYYNTKAILHLSVTFQAPLVFKSMTEKSQKILFMPTGILGIFNAVDWVEPMNLVILCDAKLPEDNSWIHPALNLGEMLLIDAAHEKSQYVANHPDIVVSDPEALAEIQAAKLQAVPFHVDHFYCTTWGMIAHE